MQSSVKLCANCNQPIELGTPIAWDRDRNFYHAVCKTKPDPTKPEPTNKPPRQSLVQIDDQAAEEMGRLNQEDNTAVLLRLIEELAILEKNSFLYPTSQSQERRSLIDRIAHLAKVIKLGAQG